MAVLRRGAELAKQKTKRSLRRWRTRFVLAKLALLEAGYILAHPRMWPEIYRRRKRRWQAFRKEARQIWRWFYQILKLYFRSEERYYAYGMVFLLVACMLAINHANVINNELQGEIQTTAASKEVHEFWTSVAKLIGLFVISTPLVVFYQWYQDKFEINWRAWLFRFYIDKWTENQNHYRMRFNSKVDNPEERLTQTLADYTSTINNLFNTTFAAVVALISFVYIVWHISPKLLLIALGYTMLVTLFNIAIGRKLFRLRFSQRKKEADNRYTLTRVRDHVESIAFYRGEAKENATIKQRFLWVVTNYNLLIGWQRNMGVVKQIYDYANTLLPWLIIPQLYFLGLVKFGAISQGSDALGQVLAALSLVIANWDDLTDFFAIVRRLGEFHDAVTNPPEEPPTSVTTVESDHVEFDDVTANSPSHKALARHICFALAAGQSLLIVGASGTGKTTVFRMLMGLSRSGSGRILRPPLEKFDFLPQNPYMPLGTLRDQLTYPAIDRQITDAQLKAALAVVGLETLPDRFVDKGGFDAVEIWEQVLSPGMQQRLSFLRVMLSDRPNVCLDEATSALDEKNENRIYQLLRDKKKTFISVGHRRTLVKHHDFVLELSGDEQSRLYTQAQYKEKLALDEARDDDEPSP
jgi:putative ATP-binding cassette transporter